eukprot:TRINITY_DN11269_c0_g1_i1.p1 TRINITY_DN11269_c0_g1~~TRINITY_DN11269_c0_g1_i1.p1  ORF type:complete len:335 (-),score=64.10 TRINITY_DN11269_c0_g1_i1:233-1183(-)
MSSSGKNALLQGCVPALITPFTADGSAVKVDVVPALVKLHLDAGVGGFYLCGNTGEGFACTVAERKVMVEATMAAVAGAKPVVVHVGACPLEDAIELAKHAKECNCAGVASVVPLDKPNNLAAAAEYFAAVGAVTDLPFYVYWVAANADTSVNAEQFLEAMKGVPNFQGVKFTDSNFFLFQQLHYLAPSVLGHPINAITGPDEIAVAGLAMGSDGAIGSTYNIQPKLNVAMHAAFRAGDVGRAMKLQEQLNVVIAQLIKSCDCKSRNLNIIAGLKAVYRARGLDVGPCRAAAATELTEEATQELVAFLDGLDWKVE